jgi:hypothetical protein
MASVATPAASFWSPSVDRFGNQVMGDEVTTKLSAGCRRDGRPNGSTSAPGGYAHLNRRRLQVTVRRQTTRN